MRKRKKTNNWIVFLILICLFGISIGYSTLSSTLSMTGQVTVNVAATPSLEIGDTVNYSTSMNGVTLDNWKVFYIDGDYTTLIYGDYLPNAAIDTTQTAFSNLTKSTYAPTYGIYANDNRIQLLEAMNTKSNWTSLLTGTINGTPINYASSSDTNVWAMGSPTLDLWVNSWNSKYPEDTIYTATTTSAMSDGLNGYYVGLEENPSTYYVEILSKAGYNNTLYYPHQEYYNNCQAYWLASPSAENVDYVMDVHYYGDVFNYGYNFHYVAFRPVVCLPTNILNQ